MSFAIYTFVSAEASSVGKLTCQKKQISGAAEIRQVVGNTALRERGGFADNQRMHTSANAVVTPNRFLAALGGVAQVTLNASPFR